MSRKRYISTDISTDTKLAELSEHGLLPLLLFTWAIPHMDDWGRITGDARQFKLLVCPALDVSSMDVEEAIEQIAKRGLWERYKAEGKECISIPGESWFKHQSYINKTKRTDDSGSNFPNPDNHRKTPQNADEHRETPQITEEQQQSTQNAASFSFSPSFSFTPSNDLGSSGGMGGNSPYSIFEKQGFGKIDEITAQFISDAIDEYTEDWVRRAMIEAVRQGIKKWSYIDNGILKRWKETGHSEPWTLEKPKVNTSSHGKQNGIGNVAQFRGQRARPQMEVFNADAPPPPSKDELVAMWQAARQLDGKPPLSDSEIADRLAQERGRQRA